MKILVNAAFAGREPVGITRYLLRVIPPLAARSDVTLLTSCPDLFSNCNCELVELPASTRGNLERFLWVLTRLRGQLGSRHDVLLSPTPEVPPWPSTPTIAIVHDLIPLIVSHLYSSKYKAYFWATLQTLRWASFVIAVSRYTARELCRRRFISPKRVRVVYSGPGLEPKPPSSLCPTPLDTSPFILYVGGHMPHKNVPALVNAFSRIRDHEGLKLVLAGWGTQKHLRSTWRAIHLYGVKDRVLVLQNISDEELSQLYQTCSAFVLPSLQEGFGLPVLEALAHGAPVACSAASALPEVAGDTAVYFNPLRPDDISAKIRLLLENNQLTAELRRRGPQRASLFSWDNTAEQIIKIAEFLVSKRK